MAPIVVLTIAFAVVAAGVVGVATLQLVTAGRRLQRQVQAAAGRLGGLVEELQDELAVTQTELTSLEQARGSAAPSRGAVRSR